MTSISLKGENAPQKKEVLKAKAIDKRLQSGPINSEHEQKFQLN